MTVLFVCIYVVNMFCHRGPQGRLAIIAKRISLLKYCINKNNNLYLDLHYENVVHWYQILINNEALLGGGVSTCSLVPPK